MNDILIDLLKNTGCIVSNGTRWLYWDILGSNGEWRVNSREPYQKRNRCLYAGADLAEAIKALTQGDNDDENGD